MPQVIIVSNRLPVSVKKEDGKLTFSPSVGGLATGLASYVNDKQSIWIGWPGIASDELDEQDRETIVKELAKHNCSPVFLTQKQIDEFYNGYSNTVLWPLFHKMRPQDKPGEQRERWYKTYRAVNKLFAETVEVATENDAQVWVHDYQLLLVPEMLRDMKLNATIGFFLHIPFPDAKKFTSFSDHQKILKGVVGADLIGFHTPSYVENFLATCKKIGLGKAGEQELVLKDRTVRVADFPMGIDYEKYSSAGKTKLVKQAVKNYRRLYKGKKLIVAVDRLDPSKGLLERLKTYEQFLTQYPKMREKVVFAMVAAPSRTDVPAYQRLAKRLNEKVAQINHDLGTSSWQPVDYINRTVPFEEVTALFQIADVAFIAPLRDGMNLAAKEFVASAHKDSVLILSETAGAAEELRDALIVNPRKPETAVAALYDSLTMRRSDLRRRLKRMKRHLKINTVHTWAKDFVETLQKPIPSSQKLTRPLTRNQENLLVESYANSRKRLMLLDYDGSLVGFSSDHREAKPNKSLLRLLERLSSDPANDVVIISGRSADNLEEWFGNMPINLVAEHGASYKLARSSKWQSHYHGDNTWKELLLPVFEKYANLTPGASVEEKTHSIVWHYRSAPPYYAQKYIVILKRVLKPYLQTYDLQLLKGNKVLELKHPRNNKGSTAKIWTEKQYDFVLGIGDDTTDEDLFKVLPKSAYGIKVGRGRTAANYRVLRQPRIIKLLEHLAG